jgi:hypothetical protein
MVQFEHFRCPLHRYTFSVKTIRHWVEEHCEGRVLNLFAGQTLLNFDETRNDLDPEMPCDYHLDALEFLRSWRVKNLTPFYLIHLMLIAKAWRCTKAWSVARSGS